MHFDRAAPEHGFETDGLSLAGMNCGTGMVCPTQSREQVRVLGIDLFYVGVRDLAMLSRVRVWHALASR